MKDFMIFAFCVGVIFSMMVTSLHPEEKAALTPDITVPWVTVLVVGIVGVLAYSTIAGLCFGWLVKRAGGVPLPCPNVRKYGHVGEWCERCRSWDHYKHIIWKALAWPLWPLALPHTLFKAAASLSLPHTKETNSSEA